MDHKLPFDQTEAMRFLVWLLFVHNLSCLAFTPTWNDGFSQRQSVRLSEKVTVQDLLPESAIEQVVGIVSKRLKLPYVPDPVISYVLTQLLGKIGSDISDSSMERLEEALQAQATETEFDNVPASEIQSLARQMAKELNPNIDIPILDEQQELLVLEEMVQIVLLVLTTKEEETRLAVWEAATENRNLVQDLSTPEGRQELVQALNAAMDVPILNEDQEEAILHAAVEAVAGVLTQLLPTSFLPALQGESPAGLESTKQFIVQQVNENIDMIGLNESQERDIIALVVDLIVDSTVDQTPRIGFLCLLSNEEQKIYWSNRRSTLDENISQSQRRYRREQFQLSMQRNRMDMRLAASAKKSAVGRNATSATNTNTISETNRSSSSNAT